MEQAAQKVIKQQCVIKELAASWDLDAVYSLISKEIGSTPGLLGDVSRHLLSAPGKGLRPLLVLISSSFGNIEKTKGIRLAAAMEILHMAMLVHDDVLDCSAERRGIPSINSRWDNNTAILTGDYLFGKSLEMVSGFGEGVVQKFSEIIMQSTIGEFQQAETIFDPSLKIEAYKDRIRKKTAVLIANCCSMAGLASGAPDSTVADLEHFGSNVGMAFQIKDDIVDWSDAGKRLGKPVVHDLRQGVLTLPVIFVLQFSSKSEHIKQVIRSQKISEQELSLISQEIKNTGCLDLAFRAASSYVERALKCLNYLPEISGRQHLEKLVKNIL